ncbi:MAG TPA: hypothetical protein VEZ72_07925 [Paenibacillus sp.]|nr:hypothetical protein [Paenibacillus sp.]
MHHPYFEEWKASEEARRLDDVGRHAWKLEAREAARRSDDDECAGDRSWRMRLGFATLRVCVSFRWGGQPER